MFKYDEKSFKTYDEYALYLIERRASLGLSYSEIYKMLTGEDYANDNARKSIYGLKAGIEMRQAFDNGIPESVLTKETFEYNSDGSFTESKVIEANEGDFKSPSKILEMHGYDPKAWELVSAKQSKWNVNSVANGMQTLYSSTVRVKPKVIEFDLDWFRDAFAEVEALNPVQSCSNSSNIALELNLADLHIGLRGLEYENEIIGMLRGIVDEIREINPELILLPFGQDFLNHDHNLGSASHTVKGTAVESSLTYKEMVSSGVRVISYLLDNIAMHTESKVIVPYILGNHDEHSSYAVMQAIMQRYRFNENITFDDEIIARKYFSYGITGIGFGHGQSEGKRIYSLFATEAPVIFATTKQREFHLSHLHHESTVDENGVTFRRMPTVNKADKWHTDKGFVGATRRIQAFVYDKNTGLKEIKYYYLPGGN